MYALEKYDNCENDIPCDLQKLIGNENAAACKVIEKTLTIILGNENDAHNVFIGRTNNIFSELKDVFAWSYNDMPEIYLEIFQHYIPFFYNFKHIKQHLRQMRLDWVPKV